MTWSAARSTHRVSAVEKTLRVCGYKWNVQVAEEGGLVCFDGAVSLWPCARVHRRRVSTDTRGTRRPWRGRGDSGGEPLGCGWIRIRGSVVHRRGRVPADHERLVPPERKTVPLSLPSDLESEPAVAAPLFGDGIDRARTYTQQLAAHGEELGLVGPSEYPRLWTRHIVNSVLLAPLLRGSVGDIGSGAGLPGIPLAIARPDVTFTLIEPMERRTDWLTQQVELLGLENVTVVRARAEDVLDDFAFDQVTARAVSALSKLIPITVPFLKDGGELVLLKGKSAEAEITKAAKVIRKYRLQNVRVEELGLDVDTESTRVLRADLVDE